MMNCNVYTIRDREFDAAEKQQKQEYVDEVINNITVENMDAIVGIVWEMNEYGIDKHLRRERYYGIEQALSGVCRCDRATMRMLLNDLLRTFKHGIKACKRAGYEYPISAAHCAIRRRAYDIAFNSLMQ